MPKVTIDFGDGRVMKRTLAGNTVMYICLSNGSVIDALPGVYTPVDFLKEAQKTVDYLRARGNPSTSLRVFDDISSDATREWHKQQVTEAIKAERIRTTMSKRVIESPLLQALGARVKANPINQTSQTSSTNNFVQDPHSALEAVSARIEDLSKQPTSAERVREMYLNKDQSKKPTPEEIGRKAIEMDSGVNVTLIRPAVHLLFSTYNDLPPVLEVRDAVYKRILHVPIDDPNLGLAAAIVPGTTSF